MKNQQFISPWMPLFILLLIAGCGSLGPKGSVAATSTVTEVRMETPCKTMTPANSSLTLTLTLDKPVYARQDNIKSTITLKNIGPDPIVVYARFLLNASFSPPMTRTVYFRIFNSMKQEIYFGAYIQVLRSEKDYFETLNPNESIEQVYNDIIIYYGDMGPGEYTIQAFYENVRDPEDCRVAWKGTLASNIVSFKILH